MGSGARALFASAFASIVFASGAAAQEYVFTQFAGSTGGPGYYDGQGTDARLYFPYRAARGRDGNLYVTDTANHTIRRVAPDGFVTTFAGRPGALGHVDGVGSAARFWDPQGIAIDSAGTIFVADSGSNTIRTITPDGVVGTWAGEAWEPGFTDGTGRSARFHKPDGIALDAAGNVYVGDRLNNAIRKITRDGVVTTMAGAGRWSMGWVDGNGSSARFFEPSGITLDSEGNVWVADSRNKVIRKVTPAGVVTTPVGEGSYGSVDGVGNEAQFKVPADLSFDRAGTLYVVDADGANVRRVGRDLAVTTVAGSGESGIEDGPVAKARFFNSWGILVDWDGALLVCDSSNYTIRRVADETVTTIAGRASDRRSIDGQGSGARFELPSDLAVDSQGNVFVADRTSIRKIAPSGVVTTLAGHPSFSGWVDATGDAARFVSIHGIAIDHSGNLFVKDAYAIRKATPDGVVTTVAGNPFVSGEKDGPASKARFSNFGDVAVDRVGNLFVADESTLRKISPAGNVTTFAGGGIGSMDGVGINARFWFIERLAIDQAGNLWATDGRNHTIRRITPDAAVTTVAGLAGRTGTVDGTGSEARLAGPHGIAVMPDGSLVVAQRSGAIRRVTPQGVVTTLGGGSGFLGNADGTGSVARFYTPTGVAVDANGTIYVADGVNSTIRAGRPALTDRATIDYATGAVGRIRTLGVESPRATSHLWRQTIIPSATGASVIDAPGEQSSTFRPRSTGLHEFLLTAQSEDGASITRVSFEALPEDELAAPQVTATATLDGKVAVGWTRVEGAEGYEVLRRSAGEPLKVLTKTALNGYDDFATVPNRAYVYHVRAFGGRSFSRLSGPDTATTFRFTDDPLLSGTVVKAVHFLELRTAIAAMREMAGMPPYQSYSPLSAGVAIGRHHLGQLREAVGQVRHELAMLPMRYTDHELTSTFRLLIKRDHILELRDAVR